jgi:mono/diheme cytochrome c family protein
MRTTLAAMILLASTGLVLAQQPADPDRGHALATMVCAQCHGVEAKGGASPNNSAPAFLAVANTPGMTAMALNAFIYTPHHLMPDLTIPQADARDLIAYILSLQHVPPI